MNETKDHSNAKPTTLSVATDLSLLDSPSRIPSLLNTPDWNRLKTTTTTPSSALSSRVSHWDRTDDCSSISSCDDILGPELVEALEIKSAVEPLDVIGEGAHAVIRRARYGGQLCAVKCATTQNQSYMHREKEVYRFLKGSRVVCTHIIGFIEVPSLLLLELADCDLMTLISKRTSCAVGDYWHRIAIQVALSVQAIHSTGLVHGDIKPRNFLLSSSQVVKLADFEAAFTIDGRLPRPQECGSDIVGSTAFSAPELLRSNACPSLASDMYAIGVTLLVLATGVEPYTAARSNTERIIQTQYGDPLRFTANRHRVVPHIERVIRGCCAKLPKHRWTAQDLTSYLQSI